MRNHYRNGLDILDAKGSCRFAPKQILITVLRVVCMPEIRASFLTALSARLLGWHVVPQHFAQFPNGEFLIGRTARTATRCTTVPRCDWLRLSAGPIAPNTVSP